MKQPVRLLSRVDRAIEELFPVFGKGDIVAISQETVERFHFQHPINRFEIKAVDSRHDLYLCDHPEALIWVPYRELTLLRSRIDWETIRRALKRL